LISKAVYYLLTETSGIDNLIDGRAEPLVVPQDPVWPLVTYNVVDASHIQTLDNYNMMIKEVQICSWSDDYLEAITLAGVIATALIGYRGTVSSFVTIFNCTLERETEMYDKDTEGVYMVSQDYKFFYKNS